MLIKQPQVQIVSKEVTLATGEVVLAYFALITIEGEVKARFLGIKHLEGKSEAPIALLSSPCKACAEGTAVSTFFESVSPYFSLDFLVNQLARAPSAI